MENFAFTLESPLGTLETTGDSHQVTYTWLSHGLTLTEPRRLLVADLDGRRLTIYPSIPSNGSLTNQFRQITELRVPFDPGDRAPDEMVHRSKEGRLVFSAMPSGLGPTFAFGLGFPRKYRGLARAIEDNSTATILAIEDEFEVPSEGLTGNTFVISTATFRDFIKQVDRNQARAKAVESRVNEADTFNLIADLVGKPTMVPKLGRLGVVKAMTRAVSDAAPLTEEEQAALFARAKGESAAAAKSAPLKLLKLQDHIELVTLDVLIENFDLQLQRRTKLKERDWQEFFENNVFALQQIFAAPVALHGAEMNLAVPSLSNTGTRIVDFLLYNQVTESAVLVELKRPDTPLLGPPYRGKVGVAVHPPNANLSGAVAQLQAQIDSSMSDLRLLASRTPGSPRFETSDVRGAVIVGNFSTLDEDEQRSFMRYRRGLAGVEILTYDEVLGRLRTLRTMLARKDAQTADLHGN